jgi:hypothetical protein
VQIVNKELSDVVGVRGMSLLYLSLLIFDLTGVLAWFKIERRLGDVARSSRCAGSPQWRINLVLSVLLWLSQMS